MSTLSQNWYYENVTEDEEDIEIIADLARKALYDQLSIGIDSIDIVMSVYGAIFTTIKEYVKEQQKDHPTYSLTIANRFEIGYTNRNDENQEKDGNFMIYMKVLENKSKNIEVDDDEDKTIELCAQWNAANITSNVEAIKKISSRSLKRISEIADVELGSIEVVMPMFCIIHEQIVAFLKVRRAELDIDEYEINLCNLCKVGCQSNEDVHDLVYFRPTVSKKREFKNDAVATQEED